MFITRLRKQPGIFFEEDDAWHTLLGALPDIGIWTLGLTPFESMQAFDKELKERLSPDVKFINGIDEKRRQ
jgi:hypothetical protein